MKYLLCFAWLLISIGLLSAATPARPADPSDPRPAQPVEPIVTPATPADSTQARPAQPVTPASSATPAASASTTTSSNAPVETALSIMADSSLRKALAEIVQNWADSQDTGPRIALNLVNAEGMRTHVGPGSDTDVVICADVQDLKDLTGKGYLAADGQHSVARNTLVVYGRAALIKDDELEWFDLIGSEWKKVALGNPDLTASGRVAKQALTKHGLISDDTKKLFTFTGTEALAINVAEREQADAVIAYKTDFFTFKLPGFQVYTIKTEDAPPVFYTAAVARLSKNPTLARSFIDYCSSDAAKTVWMKYGFETN